MGVMLYLGIILVVWNAGVYVIRKFDKPVWRTQQKESWLLMGCSGINAFVIALIPCRNGMIELLMAVFGGCLLLACITDYKTCEVYQFTWWIAGTAGLIILVQYLMLNEAEKPDLLMLLVYCLLQEFFFCKFYGRADCHAFAVCAMVAYGIGMDLMDCLIHMLLAFSGLALVQLFCRNINRKGNLKRPVAFLPYITIAFWINLCCFSLKKMIY